MIRPSAAALAAFAYFATAPLLAPQDSTGPAASGARMALAGTRSAPTLELYDLRDVCARNHLTLAPAETASAVEIAEGAADLLEVIRLYLEPKLVDGQDELRMMESGTLIARLPAEGHAWLHRFLMLQRMASGLFDIQVKIASGARGSFAEYVSENQAYAVLDQSRCLKLVAEVLNEHGAVDLVTSPRVVASNRQRISISALDQVAYVKDWEVKIVAPGNQVIADPTVDVINQGITGDFRMTLVGEDEIGCEVQFTHSKVKEPIATRKIHLPVAFGSEVEVSVPEVTTVKLSATAITHFGSGLLFCGPTQDGERDLAVLVTVEYVVDRTQIGK